LLKTDPSPDQRLSPWDPQNNVLRPSLDAHHLYREVATLRTNEFVHLCTGFFIYDTSGKRTELVFVAMRSFVCLDQVILASGN